MKKQKKRHAKQAHISKFRKLVQMRKLRQNAKCKVLQIKQSFSKKTKLRMACGLTSRKHLFSTSELQRGCCAGSKKLVRHFENASDWNVFATSRSKFEKKWLMRHVAAKTSKRIQKSSFSWEKRIHIRVILCLCKGCKRMPVVTVMT